MDDLFFDNPMYGYKLLMNGDILYERSIDKIENSIRDETTDEGRHAFVNEHQQRRSKMEDINDIYIPDKHQASGSGKRKVNIFKVKDSYRSKYF